MTRERRAELATAALAAGDSAVHVPAADLRALLGEIELLLEHRQLSVEASKLAGRIFHLEPYVARAACALESARGVLRRLSAIDAQLSEPPGGRDSDRDGRTPA